MPDIRAAVDHDVTITLADGEDYTFQTVDPNVWCEFCWQINKWEKQAAIYQLVDYEKMLSYAQSMAGTRWLAWKCIQKHHPGTPQEKVGELLGDLMVSQEVIKRLLRMEELLEVLEESKGSDPQVSPTG